MTEVTWYNASTIRPEHEAVSVRQVYGWVVSSDARIVLVSKNGHDWQLPGGKPDHGETLEQTLRREIREEAGLDIVQLNSTQYMFGYRKVTEDDAVYLQVRYIVSVNYPSDTVQLKPEEDRSQNLEDMVKLASWHSLGEAEHLIPWLGDSEEYRAFSRRV